MASTRTLAVSSRIATALAIVTVAVGGNVFGAAGDPTTGIQNSGSECVPTVGGNPFFDRSSNGFMNSGGNNLGVFCPLTKPSNDSDRPSGTSDTAKTIDRLEVHYIPDANGTAPSCMVSARASNGSVVLSQSLTPGISPISGASVLRLLSPLTMLGFRDVWGISCTLPSLTGIKGILSRAQHGQVSGGT